MINETETSKEGKYIYGIIRHDAPIEYGPIGMGTRADLVYGISFKGITAIVSNSPVIIYEARRVNMITHEKVLEEVMKQFTVLPVRFQLFQNTMTTPASCESLKRIILNLMKC